MFVKSPEVFSPQNFCCKFYDVCPIFNGNKNELENWLKQNNHPHKNFALDEIERVIVGKRQVVLVDTSYINASGEICREYRWFHV